MGGLIVTHGDIWAWAAARVPVWVYVLEKSLAHAVGSSTATL